MTAGRNGGQASHEPRDRAPVGAVGERHGLHARVVVRRGAFELDAEVSAAPGEILGVLGPNGAGKTTLLRVLAGLERCTDGLVELDGRILDAADAADAGDAGGIRHAPRTFVPPERREVGVVFQDYRLFPHLSVLDNLAFGQRARGADRAGARTSAREALVAVGLAGLERRRPGQLSGGQAQRVALARALVARPRLLLLDEPMAALDAATRLEVRTELRQRLAGLDIPVILVTHDPLEAIVLADRLVVLEGGRVVQVGTPAHVARHPATDYVARLMGLNLLRGRTRTLDTGLTVVLDGGGEVASAGSPAGDGEEATAGTTNDGVRTGEDVLVAVRPAAITVHEQRPGPASARNVWPARVVGVELIGERVRLATAGPPDLLVDVTPAAVAELGLTPGAQIWCSVKATDVVAYRASVRTP
ncbi:MAG: ABC transporter ATP-binding protein [Actinomycetales bacterium]